MESKTKSLQQVRNKVASAHNDCSPAEKLQFYNQWATQYEEDVFVLNYKAPHLAAAALASVCTVNCDSKLVLDVACGTGLVAEELQRFGFTLFHGLDGSTGMLEVAKNKQLYQELKLCMLGQDSLPFDSDKYDAVIIVGALSDGQVPVTVVLELLRVTKPGGLVCLTTRSNVSNLMYKANLEEVMSDMESKGHWEQISVQEVEQWEKAISEKEVSSKSDYIPGVIYIYRKKN
ncbi:methyltransferase-like protein 27 isoform X1 [Rana temporaria]|uniref:methyltransferase-like protein 27 isoform X1 n=1 Tax=Rana temporaria TaxID=8407 RepID=UPI001AAD4963|nr:methyltransferase-like protein 27 isoform X1 [Rana temporaria]XP_040194227.1 methyltransferase-like protein 27 isoform X1 [Rana temporaria]XP_040194228.1 methyltransferase-like protein 27 isoform X1 [Rana temporaria]